MTSDFEMPRIDPDLMPGSLSSTQLRYAALFGGGGGGGSMVLCQGGLGGGGSMVLCQGGLGGGLNGAVPRGWGEGGTVASLADHCRWGSGSFLPQEKGVIIHSDVCGR